MLKKGERLTNRQNREFQEKGLEKINVPTEELFGKYLAQDIYNVKTGEIFAEAGGELDEAKLEIIQKENIKQFNINMLLANQLKISSST